MKKVIRLTESDLIKVVKKTIKEQSSSSSINDGGMDFQDVSDFLDEYMKSHGLEYGYNDFGIDNSIELLNKFEEYVNGAIKIVRNELNVRKNELDLRKNKIR
jgi:hypothetical protein